MNDNTVVFLEGKRLILRPVSKLDIPHLTRWINDPKVRMYLAAYLPAMEKMEEEWVEKLSENRMSDFVLVIETKEGQPIGVMGVHKINWKDRNCTTGALIGEKEFWGRGYGTEAKMLLLEYLFNELGLFKVCSQAISFNKRSYNYSRRCGYRVEGVSKKHIFRKGKFWDAINLAVFREDFLRAKRKMKK